MEEPIQSLIDEQYLGKNETSRIWRPCNIYPTANIGKDVNIGMFSEIGEHVTIGDRARIGAGSFIPEGVTIEEDAWIGPHVIFANDKFPLSPKEAWLPTLVKTGAKIGAGCCILPGVTIGVNSLLGMGSTLTKDLPDGEVWAGNPARKLEQKEAK